ncbi:hypothetical protein XELAEV_18032983mg, partial [Xenopus laevis]
MADPKSEHDSEFENQEKKKDSKEELTEEEKQQVTHSEEFLIFLDRTIRVIERALAEDSNIFFNYMCFARFHLNLVIGGTYSGQIHPIYCVNVVGTQNAHNLITVSTDGKLCSWSLDKLSAPQVLGKNKAGISEIFEGHQGPVTGINCHNAVGPIDFSHLFLTSSFDWRQIFSSLCFQHNKPRYSFEDNADYVYDVTWSPVHPALFACLDGMGRMDLWNLNNDTEVSRNLTLS